MIRASIFILGSICGAFGYYLIVHSQINYNNDASELISKVLPFSDKEIKQENYRCEGSKSRKVGEVLSSIFGGSLAYKINPLSATCSKSECSIVFSSCKPWQTAECGSRILVFTQQPNGNVIPSSFKCLDVP